MTIFCHRKQNYQNRCVKVLEGELCDEAISLLEGLGLLELEEIDTGPTIHPLLAEYARHLDATAEALEALVSVLAGIATEANETGLPVNFEPLLAHVERAARAAEDAKLEDAGALWNNLGYHLDMVADYAGAREAYERALAIFEQVLGPEHPNVATLVNNLGMVLKDLGDLAGAREAFERALAIDEAAFGPDHPKVATLVNNLGSVLQALGDLAGAREAYERALGIFEQVLSPDHPHIKSVRGNLERVKREMEE